MKSTIQCLKSYQISLEHPNANRPVSPRLLSHNYMDQYINRITSSGEPEHLLELVNILVNPIMEEGNLPWLNQRDLYLSYIQDEMTRRKIYVDGNIEGKPTLIER